MRCPARSQRITFSLVPLWLHVPGTHASHKRQSLSRILCAFGSGRESGCLKREAAASRGRSYTVRQFRANSRARRQRSRSPQSTRSSVARSPKAAAARKISSVARAENRKVRAARKYVNKESGVRLELAAIMFSPYSSNSRNSPLPNFSFAESKEVWELMMVKDEQYVRNPAVLLRHPSLEARMRAILFDWMSEVSEVYKLHRETFYLAVDFVDRYLAAQTGIPKAQLQLVGITCLFIASKIEEIYPPKLSEFAYVTDGLCSEEEMLIKELVILKSLKWDLTPMTPNCWLAMYMQLYSRLEKENRASKSCKGGAGDAFMVPGYPSIFFVQIAHLLDLSMLDIGVLRFSYSVVAAAALYHFTSEEVVYQCTGKQISSSVLHFLS